MKIAFCFAITVLVACSALPTEKDPLSDEFIAEINTKARTWKAGRNFHKSYSMKSLKKLMGVPISTFKPKIAMQKLNLDFEDNNDNDIPESFDARQKWPHCTSISELRDQGSCGSCWAVSVAGAMSDRLCIHKNQQIHVSSRDLMTCCTACGFGCQGGYPIVAWEYWSKKGVVSGGPYNSSQGCMPYSEIPCEHHTTGDRPACNDIEGGPTAKCDRTCQSSYKISYDLDKSYGLTYYQLNSVKEIQREIMNNGPVVADFTVYSDFPNYKEGIYQHVAGDVVGGHAVRVIGWGVDNKIPYWLVANSWNSDWGEQGHFRIMRGTNEVGFEGEMSAGMPL